MGTTHGTDTKRSNASPGSVTKVTKRRRKLSRKWFLLALGNSKPAYRLSELGVEDIESYPPLAALVGSDGQLYWRLEDVTRLIGKRVFPDDHGVSGKDISKTPNASLYELSCRLLSTEQVYEALCVHRETAAHLFRKALTQGQCTVTYHKSRKYGIKPGLQTVTVFKLAETGLPSSIETFIANAMALQSEKRFKSSEIPTRSKRLSKPYILFERQRIYLPRKCKAHQRPEGDGGQPEEIPTLPLLLLPEEGLTIGTNHYREEGTATVTSSLEEDIATGTSYPEECIATGISSPEEGIAANGTSNLEESIATGSSHHPEV